MDDHPVPLGLPSKVLWALTDHHLAALPRRQALGTRSQMP